MATPAYEDLNKKGQRNALKRWRQNQKDAPTKAEKKAARKEAWLAEELAPGLTRKELRGQVRADTQLQFGAAQKNLQAQPARVNDYFSQYQQAIQNAAAQQAANYQQAVQGVANLQQGLNDTSKDLWAGQQAQAAADAAQRGAAVDPTLADVAHNASNMRNVLSGSYGAALIGQGASVNRDLANRRVTAEQQRGEQLSKTRGALQDFLREKGAFKVKTRAGILSAAGDAALKAALTDAQIADTRAKTANTRTDTTRAKLENAFLQKYGRLPSTTDPNSPGAKLDRARLKFFRQHGYFPPTGKPKAPADDNDKQWGTQVQQNAARDAVSEAVTVARGLRDKGYTREEVQQLMLNGRPAQTIERDGQTIKVPAIAQVGRDYANVALDVAFKGFISPRGRRVLRKRGIRPKKLGYPTDRPKAPVPPPTGVVDGVAGVIGDILGER